MAETKKELSKLRRSEIVELLYTIMEENEALRAENEKLEAKLNERRLELSECGSIAEAALKLSGIFEAAQTAADTYLKSIKFQAERL